tara:strand:+ start:37 stop:648 length:612 start_codon:yes stop_codon:yes gene_type:complete
MNSKIIIQILLIVTIITILSATFYNYFYDDAITSTVTKSEDLIKKNNSTNSNLAQIQNNTSNILNNITYENFDIKGNRYQISASTGEIKDLNSDIIYMSDVVALIFLKDLSTVKIVSKNAIFNSLSFNSNFYDNVQLNYLEHQLNGEKLDLKFNENLLILKEKVLYQSLDTKLFADAISIDLITKNSKIFMNDDEKKIKILNN